MVGRDGIEEPIGALAFETDAAPAQDVAERIAALSDLVAIVVDRARLATNAAERIDWAERVANSDMLTGLANARTLSRVMELEIARAARQGSELTIALFDVDDLTGFNDANGRAAGDDVLREVAAVMGESVRYVDTIARWGGDEFIVVAPGEKGTTVARRIVEAVAGRSMAGDRRATVSAGLARFPLDGKTGDDLVQAATSALRAARAAGPGTLAEATHDAGNGTRLLGSLRGRPAPDAPAVIRRPQAPSVSSPAPGLPSHDDRRRRRGRCPVRAPASGPRSRPAPAEPGS